MLTDILIRHNCSSGGAIPFESFKVQGSIHFPEGDAKLEFFGIVGPNT